MKISQKVLESMSPEQRAVTMCFQAIERYEQGIIEERLKLKHLGVDVDDEDDGPAGRAAPKRRAAKKTKVVEVVEFEAPKKDRNKRVRLTDEQLRDDIIGAVRTSGGISTHKLCKTLNGRSERIQAMAKRLESEGTIARGDIENVGADGRVYHAPGWTIA